MTDELQTFLTLWEYEAGKTAGLLRALPSGQYDFRPDAGGRSLGELAWHLPELEAYSTYGIEQGTFGPGTRPPGIERPRSIDALAPGYERVHAEAAARVRRLSAADLDGKITHFTGHQPSIRELLWSGVLFHLIHHRGQLSLMVRLAGGTAPGLLGPNREEMAALRARAGA
ncbi:MAG: hypothetical protein DMF78_13405 [Acidobacteria bacterium]|nr:MAG: hypothetical protein DMF78_13405 [Acidobacteriota bacterium]